jgi:ASC-1-like (ASCH) protein
MKGSWGLTPKILSGEKKIESRWYLSKRPPLGKVNPGDTIYFKDSGRPISLTSKVSRVKLIEDLTPSKVKRTLAIYGKDDGIAKSEIQKFYGMFKDKKYCMLIFLKNPKKVSPFSINKKGFGAMSAWITVKNINTIKINQ